MSPKINPDHLPFRPVPSLLNAVIFLKNIYISEDEQAHDENDDTGNFLNIKHFAGDERTEKRCHNTLEDKCNRQS